MLQQINFLEAMGVLFTALLAILFGFVLWGFFKVKSEMKKNVKQPKTEIAEQLRERR